MEWNDRDGSEKSNSFISSFFEIHIRKNLPDVLQLKLLLFIDNLPEKGKGSVHLTSLYLLVQISCFLYGKNYLLFYKTSYLNEDINRTEPSPSVSVP